MLLGMWCTEITMVKLPESLSSQSKPECVETPEESAGYLNTLPSMFSKKTKRKGLPNSLSDTAKQDKTWGLEI